MPELKPDQVPAGWNAASGAYDRDIWALMRPYVQDSIRLGRPQATDRVLDVAAGSGALTVEAAPLASEVLAVDFAEDMLGHLQRRVQQAGLTNVRSEVMDGQNLELEDDSFDAAFSNFGLIFYPDRGRGIREMHRVLRPGGRAVIAAWNGPEFELFHRFFAAVRAVLGDAHKPDGPPPIFSLSDRDQFEDEMRAGGFTDVAMNTFRHPFEIESAEAFWDVMSMSAPPAAVLLERIGDDAATRVRSTLLEQLGRGKIVFHNEAHIAVGTR